MHKKLITNNNIIKRRELMKKVIVGVVLILLTIMLCGCGANKNAKEEVLRVMDKAERGRSTLMLLGKMLSL